MMTRLIVPYKTILVFVFLLIYFFSLHSLIAKQHLMMDERFHVDQIIRFSQGDFSLSPALAMGPGYHILFALPVTLLRVVKNADIRLLVLVIHVLSLPVFYFFVRKINKKEATIKLLQFALLPIVSYHMVLVYSDIVSLTLVVLSAMLILYKWYTWSAVVGFISITVRQTNSIWYVFIFLLGYFELYGWKLSIKSSMEYLKYTYIFVLGGIVFATFIVLNQGVALGSGTKEITPILPSVGNLILLLVSVVIFFGVDILTQIKSIITWIKNHIVLTLVLAFITAIMVFTFTNNHPWNLQGYFLRNYILQWMTTDLFTRYIMWILSLVGVIYVLQTRGYSRGLLLLGIFGPLSVVLFWLVEPRYYLLAFAFYIAFRKSPSALVTFVTCILYILITFFLLYGLMYDKFFL